MSKESKEYIAVGGTVVASKFDPATFLRKLNAKLVTLEYDLKTYKFPEDPVDVTGFKMIPEIIDDIKKISALISTLDGPDAPLLESLIPSSVRGILIEVLSNFSDVCKAVAPHVDRKTSIAVRPTLVQVFKAMSSAKRKLNPEYTIFMHMHAALAIMGLGIHRHYNETE